MPASAPLSNSASSAWVVDLLFCQPRPEALIQRMQSSMTPEYLSMLGLTQTLTGFGSSLGARLAVIARDCHGKNFGSGSEPLRSGAEAKFAASPRSLSRLEPKPRADSGVKIRLRSQEPTQEPRFDYGAKSRLQSLYRTSEPGQCKKPEPRADSGAGAAQS
ncbi:unnamed protein product [Bursaphelenchus xylophilus]|uniref:(pine wood nematode) hypothetical protein n=1 Tax=Bursaphelenchus xylophilus TaxID=6326 RepID=A0A1I7SCS1_BURXY|nr:unnamed protein product [Bursaphelenchus xylophilus]CAG9093612.1 unnamed protein product [Bursaphelenchus xylophilus]